MSEPWCQPSLSFQLMVNISSRCVYEKLLDQCHLRPWKKSTHTGFGEHSTGRSYYFCPHQNSGTPDFVNVPRDYFLPLNWRSYILQLCQLEQPCTMVLDIQLVLLSASMRWQCLNTFFHCCDEEAMFWY